MGEARFWWVKGTQPEIIAQVTYVPYEGIKSNVVQCGLEFPRENKGSDTLVYTIVGKEWLLVYTHKFSV